MFPMKPFLARACLVPFGGPWIPGPDTGTQWRKTIPTDRQLWPENGRSLITCWWIRILSLCRSLATTSLRVEQDSLLWSWSFVRGVIFRTKWMQVREPSNLQWLKNKHTNKKKSQKEPAKDLQSSIPKNNLWCLEGWKNHKRPSCFAGHLLGEYHLPKEALTWLAEFFLGLDAQLQIWRSSCSSVRMTSWTVQDPTFCCLPCPYAFFNGISIIWCRVAMPPRGYDDKNKSKHKHDYKHKHKYEQKTRTHTTHRHVYIYIYLYI